ncbi:YadA-like family protein [Psychrobacter lutiphocae]|uniref:YadA-like family protein n=1 Tax=Psychrobacter lutiphocae TaxID=540500 RepID=UPI00036E8CB0|nr:YadA-like family protein [Psychrobacter lutiphocae]
MVFSIFSALGISTQSYAASYGAGGGTATGGDSVAIGNNAKATKVEAVAIGSNTDATGQQSVAIGNDITAGGDFSIVIGTQYNGNKAGYQSEGKYSVAIGSGNNTARYAADADGNFSIALGSASKTEKAAQSSVAIGDSAKTTEANAVALGSDSVGDRVVPTVSGYDASVLTSSDPNQAATSKSTTWRANRAAVSVGDGTRITRQITSVAAGSADTDAVNVAQLKAVDKDTFFHVNDGTNGGTGNPANNKGKVNEAAGATVANALAAGINAKATENNATAVGRDTQSNGTSASAFGSQAKANANYTLAAGYQAETIGESSNAIGAYTIANGQNSTAIGVRSHTYDTSGISIGNGAKSGKSGDTSVTNTIAIGTRSVSSGDKSVAIGHGSDATESQSVAIGGYAQATATDTSAFGRNSIADIAGGVAIGSQSNTYVDKGIVGYDPSTGKTSTENNTTWKANQAAVAIGNSTAVTRQITSVAAGAKDTDAVNVAQLKAAQTHYFDVNSTDGGNYNNDGATGADALAAGKDAAAIGSASIAIGLDTTSEGANSIAIGEKAASSSNNSIAIGADTKASSTYTTSIGRSTQATKSGATAIGGGTESGAAKATSAGAVAIGGGYNSNVGANAEATRSVAIGNASSATLEDSIALGSKSVTTRDLATASGYDARTGQASTLTDSAWRATTAAVSVGDVDNNITRQITSVAAGAKDTDAVNVAQLKAAQTHYFDVNSTGGGNYNNDGATGADAIAIGKNANASKDSNISLGNNARALGETSIAIGKNARTDGSSGVNSIAIGNNAYGGWAQEGIAIGTNSASSNYAVAVGSQAKNDNAGGVAIGQAARTNGARSVAVGQASKAVGTDSVVVGYEAQASKNQSTALGHSAVARHEYSVALGANSVASRDVPTVSGYDASKAGASDLNNTTWKANRAAVSVGNGTSVTRQITNLAAGSEDSDAVNVAQLKALEKTTNTYFHTGTGATGTGNAATNQGKLTDRAGATGNNSLAAGVNTRATSESSVAIGPNAIANKSFVTAIGSGAGLSTTQGESSVYLGRNAGSNGNHLVHGQRSWGSVYIGQDAGTEVTGDASIGIGSTAGWKHTGSQNIFIGDSAKPLKEGQNAYSYTSGNRNLIFGNQYIDPKVKTAESGKTNYINDVIVIGTLAKAENSQGIAIGSSRTDGVTGAYAKGKRSIAIGVSADETKKGAQALGDDSIALGTQSKADQANSVVLGNLSTDRAATAETTATVGGITYGNFAGVGSAPNGVVSVGDTGKERQLINVAAGKINATSTDAINGSQLHAVAKAPLTFTGNTNADTDADGTQQQLGSTLNIIGSKAEITLAEDVSNIAMTGAYSAKNLQTVVTDDQVQIQLAESPKFGKVTINDGGKITGLTAGEADTDAVNVSQLNAVKNVKNYAHVNDGTNAGTGDADSNLAKVNEAGGAQGKNAVAIGVGAQAIGRGSVVVGSQAAYLSNEDTRNIATGNESTISGGINNKVAGNKGTISGGVGNEIQTSGLITGESAERLALFARGATISGGTSNIITNSHDSTIGGGYKNEILESVDNNGENGFGTNTIAGGGLNSAKGNLTTIGGGWENTIENGVASTIAGGTNNKASEEYTTVSGGTKNEASARMSTVSGGYDNDATGIRSSIGGGFENKVSGESSTISGGYQNKSLAAYGTIAGGGKNTIETTGRAGFIAGSGNTLAAPNSAIIGTSNTLKANQQYSFVLGNATNTTQANSVTLGHLSSDKEATTVTEATVGDITYGDFSGVSKVANGVVSVGGVGTERQIVNVGAGRVAVDSTDAINGSQLHATNNVVSNVGNTLITEILGGDAAIEKTGTTAGQLSMSDIGGTGKDTIHNAIKNLNTTITENDRDTYFHTNATGAVQPLVGSNKGKLDATAGASGINATAAGINARATGNSGVAVGNGAWALDDNALAIGKGARVDNYAIAGKTSNTSDGIAIGTNARSVQGGLRDGALGGLIPSSPLVDNYIPGSTKGIAIGKDTYANESTVDIGAKSVNNQDKGANRRAVTSVGADSFAGAHFSTIVGSYSTIESQTTSPLSRSQGFASTVTGTLNTVKADSATDPFDGVANVVNGAGNTINHSNGTVVVGAGNTVSNSLQAKDINPAGLSFANITKPDELNEILKDAELGSVGIIGGGNTVDNALYSNVQGVKNSLTSGTNGDTSAFVSMDGYKNTAENVSNITTQGSNNTVTNADQNIIMGDNNTLVGDETDRSQAKRNIIIGFQDTQDQIGKNITNNQAIGSNLTISDETTNGVLIGDNTIIKGNGAVALGAESNASRAALTGVTTSDTASATANEVYALETATDDDKNAISATVKGDLAAVSVGNADSTRQITNVAAGSEDSDAVNVSQLKAVANVPLTFAGDSGADFKRKLGETVTVEGGVTDASLLSDNNIGVVSNAADTLTVKLAKELGGLTSAEFTDANGNENIITGDGLVITPADTSKNRVRLNSNGLDNGDNKIVNVAAGEKDSDAVNVSQLKSVAAVAAAKTKVEKGTNTTVTSETDIATGAITYTVDARDTTAKAGSTAVSVTGGELDPTTNVRDYSIDLSQETKNSIADGKKHNTVVAGNNVSITEGTNTDEGVEYTVNAEKSTVSSDSLAVTSTPNAETNTTDYKVELEAEDQATLANAVTGFYVDADVKATADKAADNVKLTETVTYTADDSNVVTTVRDNEIGFKLADDVTIANSLTVGPVSINKDTGIDAGDTVITHVKAGTADTDAVNVSQLKDTNTNVAKGFNIAADNGTTDNVQLGDTVTYTSTDDNVVTTVTDNQIDFSLANQISVGTAKPVTINGDTGTVNGLTNTTYNPNNIVTGQAATEDQLQQATIAATSDVTTTTEDQLTVTTIAKEDGTTTYQVDADVTVLTTDSKGHVITPANSPNGLVTATNVADTINATGWNLQNDGVQKDLVSPSNTVNFVKGSGTEAVVTSDGNVSTVTYNVLTDDTITLNAKTNELGVNTGTITQDTTKPGTVATPNSSAIATTGDVVDAINNSGFTVKANGEDAGELINPGDAVDFTEGKNISITREAGKFTVATKADVDFDKVTVGPVTINKDAGINAGNTKVTNVAEGVDPTDAVNVSQLNTKVAAATTEVKAGTNIVDVTKKTGDKDQTIYTVNAKGTTASANSDAVEVKGVAKDGNVTDYEIDLSAKSKESLAKAESAIQSVTGDSNITATTDADNKVTVKLNDDITVKNVNTDSTTIGGTVAINDKGINAGNTKITNVAAGEISANSQDAVNGSQLHEVKNLAAASKTTVKAGKNTTVTGSTDEDTKAMTYVVNADSASVSAGSDAVAVAKGTRDANGNTDYKVDLSAKTKGRLAKADTAIQSVTGDSNITATTDADNKVTVKLNDDITVKNVNTDSTTIGGTVAINDKGINAGNTKITNVAQGTADTDAVNVSQLKATNANIAKGFNISADNGNPDNVQLGETVHYTSDDKNIVTTVRDNEVDLGLAKEITVDSVTAGNTVVNNAGVTITNPEHPSKTVSVTNQGVNAGGNRVTNVAPGVNPTDAVNVDQLNQLGYKLTGHIDDIQADLSAGIASAAAIENAPYVPGKWTYAAGASYYNSESAIGVSLRRTADNGRWSITGGVSTNTQNDPLFRIGISGVID